MARQDGNLPRVFDAHTATQIISTYRTVAELLIQNGMGNEVHESRLLEHIQANTTLKTSVGARVMAALEVNLELQRSVEKILPGVPIGKARAQNLFEEIIQLPKSSCVSIPSTRPPSLDLVCVDRTSGNIRVTLVRR